VAYQIFVSHTQYDRDFCDAFDRACARVGIKAFRSEFESIEMPAWKTIKGTIDRSRAMFLLVGKQLTTYQTLHPPEWEYTQNWIAYETGLACQKGIDVWVICDEEIRINFPVPYFNNYAPFGLSTERNFRFIREILTAYSKGYTFHLSLDTKITCPYQNCRIEFNLHAELEPGWSVTCPQCLGDIQFPEGFLKFQKET